MATGVPRRPQEYNGRNRVTSPLELRDGVAISYAGKKSRKEILAHPPSVLRKVTPTRAVRNSRLYFGDNLGVLAKLARDPNIHGRIRLVYIDPPFATRSRFHSRSLTHAYSDDLAGADYLEFLRERLIWIHELLAPDGSLYLHLDDKMVFPAKLLLDEIFGPTGYRNSIVRRKCNPKNYTRKQYGNLKDYVLFYTKSSEYVWNRPTEQWGGGRDREYRYLDPGGRRFMKVPVHAPGVRRGETGKPWRGMLPPPGKHWQYLPRILDEMDARGEIYWSPNGNPRRKVYFDDSSGIGVQDIWTDFPDAHNQNICITGYPTEKNPDLLKRIIEASSNPGDLVLDCFSGSGTTAVVSEALGRRWIVVDNSPEALRTTLRRFAVGTNPMGDFVERKNGTSSRKPLGERVTDFAFWADAEVASEAEDIFRDSLED